MILIQPPVVQNWNSLVNKPSILSDNQVSWGEIQNKPTTLIGYGITNALALTGGTITGDLVSTSATPSTSPTTGASRVTGGQGIGGNQYVGGFSSLGGDANHPGIKIKELRGLTAAVQGGTTQLFNGVNRDKILALSVIVLRTAIGGHTQIWTPGITIIPGYYFEFYLDLYNYTVVLLHPTNSGFILSKEIVVTILYKE
jgi:hypothetical protein